MKPSIRNLRAFPEQQPDMNHKGDAPGMTLRQYYAGQAMQGLISDPQVRDIPKNIAKVAVELADALCEELLK